jgi:hypothetical protein
VRMLVERMGTIVCGDGCVGKGGRFIGVITGGGQLV